MRFDVFSQNGEILPAEAATVSLFDVAYEYGYGVYESLRVVRGIPYFLDEHLARLERSAALIGLSHPFSIEQVAAWVRALADRIEEPAYNLKILLVGGPRPEDARLSILPLAPSFPERSWYRDGVAACTARHERWNPDAKTLNMLPSYLLYRDAKAKGCYDALLVDRDGAVREGTRTNVFIVEGDILATPSADRVLGGVARKLTLILARRSGWTVREEAIPLERLLRADAAFFTSTSSKVLPIATVDGAALPPVPERLRSLQRAYEDELERCQGVMPSS